MVYKVVGVTSWYTFYMKSIVISGIYLAALLSLSVFVFEPTNLYFELWWLDIPMHVLGGFGVASLCMSISYYYNNKKISLLSMLVLYLIIAIGWELYELMHDIVRNTSWGGWGDTLDDIFNGAIGASVAYYFLKK